MIPNFPPPPPLPDPPLVTWLLLEGGWLWTTLGLVVLAWAVGMALRASGRGRAGRWAGAALLLAGAGVALMAKLVETGREGVLRRTVGMVGAAAGGDRGAMDRVFAQDITVQSSLVRTKSGKSALIEEIAGQVSHYRVKDWAVVENQAQASGDPGRSQFLVRVESADGGLHFSWWSAEWRLEDGQWRTVTIKPVAVQGVSGLD